MVRRTIFSRDEKPEVLPESPRYLWISRNALGFAGPVLASSPSAILYTFSIKSAANNVVADARQVFYPTASHQDYRVFLQVVPFAANVGGNFNAIGQPYPGNLTQRRVRLFRCHGAYLNTYAAPLGTS